MYENLKPNDKQRITGNENHNSIFQQGGCQKSHGIWSAEINVIKQNKRQSINNDIELYVAAKGGIWIND